MYALARRVARLDNPASCGHRVAMSDRSDVARRYATWIERHRVRIVALSLALAAVCGVLASRLAIRSDFSYLLPQSARSVQDLRAIERRARVIGTAMIAVQSANPQHREQ